MLSNNKVCVLTGVWFYFRLCKDNPSDEGRLVGVESK